MHVLAKIGAISMLAVAITAPGDARAEVGPDSTFSGTDVYPTTRTNICLGAFCPSATATEYGASQSHDCNKAGLGNPRPVYGTPSIGADLNYDRGTGGQYLRFPRAGFGMDHWPENDSRRSGFGADQGPDKGYFAPGGLSADQMRGLTDEMLRSSGFGYDPDVSSINVEIPSSHSLNDTFRSSGFDLNSTGYLDSDVLSEHLVQQIPLGGTNYATFMFEPKYFGDIVSGLRDVGITVFEINGCRVVLLPTDPNYERNGRNGGNSWGEKQDDQWAIKRVGFTADEDSAWNKLPATAAPVIVAVIDTGLDWHHLDISAENIWRNTAEDPDNGVDDDNNGYVDDIIGWDFLGKHNKPWDFDGHGTVVAGIIAATHNDAGIAGINPHAKIMVLKAVNNFGTSRASFLAEAIVYAVDNGAKVINISVGGSQTSRVEQAALNYAHQAGVLVVAASGNEGVELGEFGPGGSDYVLTVGATHVNDRAAAFSNYGDKVDIVAPGVDVLSLRARFTDANFRPGPDGSEGYSVGDNYVGDDKRYLYVSGTSFSTPIVAATASLLFSKQPSLTAQDVKRILIETASDIESPGIDKHTGHGMLDARQALSVDAEFSITAEITGIQIVPAENPQTVQVLGTIDASEFKRAWLQIGPGESPAGWKFVGQKRKFAIRNGVLASVPKYHFGSGGDWQIVINVEHQNGVIKRTAFPVNIK